MTDEELAAMRNAGRPCVLTDDTMIAIRNMIKAQVQTGTRVTSRVLQPLIQAVVEYREEGDRLAVNGGALKLSAGWINRECRNLNLAMRKPTTAAQKLPPNWEEQAELFSLRLSYLVMRYNLDPAQVVNSDQTGVHLVPTGSGATRAEKVRYCFSSGKKNLTLIYVLPTFCKLR